MDAAHYNEDSDMVYLFIGNLEKRSAYGHVKVKACQDLMRRLLRAVDLLLGFNFSDAFTVIPSRKILTYGRTNG